ncbi:MAG: T9SS type A sorting domain-containing protein, partial [Saprospiraceae bacterium]|nr:T9SS type A sorting domain-containing protein [Saprospiraceae bacterium]
MYLFTHKKNSHLLNLAICSALLLANTGLAQPTISSDYIAIGQKFRIVLYETNLDIDNQLIDIINAEGPNQSWDFSNLNYIDSTVTFEEYQTIDPNDPLLNNPVFAGSNVLEIYTVLPVEGGSPDTTVQYRYATLENNNWRINATVSFIDVDQNQIEDTIISWFSPPTLQIQFPVDQNTFWADSTSIFQDFQGMQFVSSIMLDTTQAQGWGTLTTPAGTVSALRLLEKTVTQVPNSPIVDVSNDLDFVSPEGIGASIVLEDGRAFYSTRTNLNPMTPTRDLYRPDAAFIFQPMFPNPTHSLIHIPFSLEQTELITIRVLDVAGREVERIESEYFSPGQHQISWSTERLTKGTYFMEVQGGGVRQYRKL